MVKSIFINFLNLLLYSESLFASVIFRVSSLYTIFNLTLNLYLQCFMENNSIETGFWYESHFWINVEVQENL